MAKEVTIFRLETVLIFLGLYLTGGPRANALDQSHFSLKINPFPVKYCPTLLAIEYTGLSAISDTDFELHFMQEYYGPNSQSLHYIHIRPLSFKCTQNWCGGTLTRLTTNKKLKGPKTDLRPFFT